ncbi:MAG: GTPase ObgE [Proteobacteria bacterium]|nr:GTPase ObgE [Pseudomonadota bacterium]
MRFIDEARIRVISGSGGNGCVSFRREKFVPRGGPDGGDGGKGGDIIIQADRQVSSLSDFHFRQQFKAQSGIPGKGKKLAGRNGQDVVIPVPAGTVVRDAETGDLLRDLDRPGDRYVAVWGGKGGRGNSHFATSTDQAPRRAETGVPGEEKNLFLELKLLADVGLLGLPNAGKSTFISKLTSAHPKIADYPFTTLSPNLGVAESPDRLVSYVIADIPGLIEGAHRGQGLGIQFLKHLERTRILLLILDLSRPDPKDDYRVLLGEITAFGQGLPEKPRIVVLNKVDLQEGREKQAAVEKALKRKKVRTFPISALTGEGIREVADYLLGMVQKKSDDGKD